MIPFFDSDRIHNLGSFTALSKINKKNNIIMFGQVIRQNLELIDTWIDLKFCSNLLSCFILFLLFMKGYLHALLLKKIILLFLLFFNSTEVSMAKICKIHRPCTNNGTYLDLLGYFGNHS